jgi:hypothetical protein
MAGYVRLAPIGMTPEQIAAADKYNLWIWTKTPTGGPRRNVMEHRLVAAMKYRRSLGGLVVRHVNGVKTDNRPENLLLGTDRENKLDHSTARAEAMTWRAKYEAAAKEAGRLYGEVARLRAILGPTCMSAA